MSLDIELNTKIIFNIVVLIQSWSTENDIQIITENNMTVI